MCNPAYVHEFEACATERAMPSVFDVQRIRGGELFESLCLRSQVSKQQSTRNAPRITNTKRKRKQPEMQKADANEEQQILQRTYKLARPRIIKSDFRRSYAAQWVDVFNSCSYDRLMDHVQHYYNQDMSISQRDLRAGMNLYNYCLNLLCI